MKTPVKRLLILPVPPVLHVGTQHIPDTPCSAKRDRAVADQECPCCLQSPQPDPKNAADGFGQPWNPAAPISAHETQFGSCSTQVQVHEHSVQAPSCPGVFMAHGGETLCSWKLDWSQDKEPSAPSSTQPLLYHM